MSSSRVRTLWRLLTKKERPVRYLIGLFLRVTRLSCLFTIRTPRYVVRFFPTNMTATLWEDPAARTEDETFIDAFVGPGDTVIDVGANIGTLTLTAARNVGRTGRVHAFEPNPRIYSYLVRNIALNKYTTIRAENLALGDKNGTTVISDIASDDGNHITRGDGITIPLRTLDSLFPGTKRIDLLKIDVEGYELHVLRGASRLLRRTRGIYIESYAPNLRRFGFTTAMLRALLAEHGFQFYAFEDGRLRLLGPKDTLPWQLVALKRGESLRKR